MKREEGVQQGTEAIPESDSLPNVPSVKKEEESLLEVKATGFSQEELSLRPWVPPLTVKGKVTVSLVSATVRRIHVSDSLAPSDHETLREMSPSASEKLF